MTEEFREEHVVPEAVVDDVVHESAAEDEVHEGMDALHKLFIKELTDCEPNLERGLINLARLPEFDLKNGIPARVPGHVGVQCGIIGFRRMAGQMALALACGIAPISYLQLEKFIAIIELMHDESSATVNLQSPVSGKDGCGQIIARLNPSHSAIHVMHGVVGKVIKRTEHIVSNEVYYLPRTVLVRFYLAAKAQIEAGDQLDSLIAAYDGVKGYSIPVNPLKPELQ